MSVTEKLMAPGQFNLTLDKSITPNTIVNSIDAWGQIVIVPADLNVNEFSDATLLDAASYVGIVYSLELGEEDSVNIYGQGLTAYLGDSDTRGMPISETGGNSGVRSYSGSTLENVLDHTGTPKGLLRDEAGNQGAIRKGTITEPSGTYTGKHYTESALKAIKYVCQDLGVEFKISTTGYLDAGPVGSIFSGHSSDPTSIIVRDASGEDPNIDGIATTSLLAQYDASEFVSQVELIANKYGAEANIGNATASTIPYKDLFGNNLKRIQYVSDPQTQGTSKTDRATSYLNELNTVKKTLNVSLEEYDISGDFVVGDKIFIYDPDIGFVDTEADKTLDGRSSLFEAVYQGQVLNPTKIRILGITWPVKQGYGVFYRDKDGNYTELTDYCVFEEGDVQLEIGDVAPTIGESLGFSGYTVDQTGSPDKSVPGQPTDSNGNVGLNTVAGTYSDGNGISKAFIKVTWNQPNNTDGSSITDGAYYRLRYRVVQDTDGNNIIDSTDTQVTEYIYSTVDFGTREFIIYDLSPNTYYEIGVQAIDTAGFDSAFSTVSSIQTPSDAGAPNKPDGFATIASNPLRVQFIHNLGQAKDNDGNAVSPVVNFTLAKDLDHLNIHASTTQGFNLNYNSTTKKVTSSGFKIGELVATSAHIQNGIAAVGYIDLDNASTHYFRVTAVDSSGNESEPSDEQSGNAELVNTSHIANLAVTNALIANAAITNLKVADVSADKLTAGTISGQEIILNVSGDTGNDSSIRSSNYSAGSAGWKINSDGVAEFQNATIRGSLNASDITSGTLSSDRLDTDFIAVGGAASDVNSGSTTIDGDNITTGTITTGQLNFSPLENGDAITSGSVGGITINAANIQSNYSAGTSGFLIESDGDAFFNSVTVNNPIITLGKASSDQSGASASSLKLGDGVLYNIDDSGINKLVSTKTFVVSPDGTEDDPSIAIRGQYAEMGFFVDQPLTGVSRMQITNGSDNVALWSTADSSFTVPDKLVLGGTLQAGGGVGSSGQVLQSTGNGVQWANSQGHTHNATVLTVDSHSHNSTNTVLNTNTSFTGMVNHIAETVGNSGTAHGLTLADVTTLGNTNVLTNATHSHGTNNINAITSNYNNNVTAYNTAFSAAGAFNLYNTINSALNNKANNSALHNSHNYFTNADVVGSHHSHNGYVSSNTFNSHTGSASAHGQYVYYNDYLNHISNFNSHTGSNNAHGIGNKANNADFVAHLNLYHGGSDERLKTNITDTSFGLEYIKTLRPVDYEFTSSVADEYFGTEDSHNKDEFLKPEHGFIAQEVRTATFDNHASNNAFGGLGYKQALEGDTLENVQTLDLQMFIGPLVKAVQELSDKIDLLEARVDELEGV